MDHNFETKCLGFKNDSRDSLSAIKFIVSVFLSDIYPLINRIAHLLQLSEENKFISIASLRDVYILCSDQIKKCISTFVDIIKREHIEGVCLQESRLCTLERISWCYQKLISIEKQLNNMQSYSVDSDVPSSNDSMIMNSMYFVNWVDQCFEVLSQLSSIIYKPSCTVSDVLYNNWKYELFECVCGLHTSVNELLLSAMTLWKYCLPTDQLIIKARCQVVLREAKSLLSDLLLSNEDSHCEAVIENLKLPIKPSNVNVLIDVLKDVLYVLETNTNTALLSLLVHCFGQSNSPVDILRNHLNVSVCTCPGINNENVVETCEFVKEFDLHNERLMQIGSFAMSCSSDQRRVLGLRSGLASLEALDPHLVPALLHASSSHHASVLVNIWSQEVMQIRDNVFLIVDPSAFAEKAKQMMQQTLLEVIKENCYNNDKACAVINIGVLVHEFFSVYNRLEPDAISQQDGLRSLLQDLNKAQLECKFVSNTLCSPDNFKYDLKKATIAKVSVEQFNKRLKLLYTIVKRIHFLLTPKDDDEEFYREEPDDKENKTYTLDNKNGNTYSVNSLKKNNMTRSIFARTDNIRSSTAKFPLAALTKHLKAKQDLSFSIKLDDICNLSEVKKREQSILYHTPMKTKSSLRKAVLNKHLLPRTFQTPEMKPESSILEKGSLMDETMNLQITDILNQLNNLTDSVATNKKCIDSTVLIDTTSRICGERIRNDHATSKQDFNNSVTDNDSVVNVTQPSDVNTLERVSDLDLVESRLSNLKFGHIETSL